MQAFINSGITSSDVEPVSGSAAICGTMALRCGVRTLGDMPTKAASAVAMSKSDDSMAEPRDCIVLRSIDAEQGDRELGEAEGDHVAIHV